jgi:hypothetical protein
MKGKAAYRGDIRSLPLFYRRSDSPSMAAFAKVMDMVRVQTSGIGRATLAAARTMLVSLCISHAE